MSGGNDIDVAGCAAPLACPVSTSCLPGRRVPCLDVGRAHAEALGLCDMLEEIADGLPSRIDRRKCLIVASTLVPLLRDSHSYEEEYVFPAFASGSGNRRAGEHTVRRLMAEHVEDECAAQDLADVLFVLGHGAPVHNAEALGFMLRAFFEAMRRHVAFEREHIFPLDDVPG